MMQRANQVQFLCSEHKQAIAGKPEYAALIWSRLIKEARDKVSCQEWNKSAVIYSNAFEVADLLITEAPSDSKRIERYIHNAIELAYVLRKCSYTSDVSILVSIVEDRLEACLYPADSTLLVKPLRSIAFAALPEVSQWITKLTSTEALFVGRSK